MKKIAIAVLAAAAFAALPSFAQSSPQGWYLGAGVGRGHIGLTGQDLTGLDNAQVKDADTTYTVRGGLRLSPYSAIELGYYDLGQYKFSGGLGNATVSGSGKAKSYGLSAVGIAPLGPYFEAYARIGIEQSEIKVNASSNVTPGNGNVGDKQTGATYGVGGRWMVTKNVGLFAEWMKNDKIQVDSYLGGIDFRF
jgi:OOP family OmpA-OmpF porin